MIFSSSRKLFTFQFLILISLLLPFSLSVNAQVKSLNKISSGLTSLYNFNFNASDKAFNDFIRANPEHPAGFYFKSIKFLWYYLDNKNEEYLNSFFAYTDTALKKFEKRIDKDSADIFSYFICSSVYYQRAVVYTRGEDYLSALWAVKTFNYYVEKILSLDSLYFDAFMCLGLYNFAISQAPHSWRWALDLTGIEGDRKIGLDYLKQASKKGKFTRVDAEFYLSQIDVEFFQNYREAEKYLKSLCANYPRNLLFRYSLGNLQVKKYDLKSAVKSYEAVLRSDDSVFTQLKNYSLMSLGDVFYTLNNFDSAKTFYRIFLENSIDDHLKGMTALKLGLCYMFSGDTAQAINYFELADDGNLDLDEDVYAKMKGEEYIEDLPDSLDLRFIRYKNILDSGKFKTAIDSLESLNQLFISDSLRAELMLNISEAYFHLGKYRKSLEYAVSLLSLQQCETRIKAFACYYAARASIALKKFDDAKLFIKYASNYKDFSYENKLTDRLNALLYQLNN